MTATKPGCLLIVAMKPARPATLQDVADAVGVHRTTAARALSNTPGINAETRAAVQAAAERLGYRANPLVAALMRARRSGRQEKGQVIAYLTCHPTRHGWRPPADPRPDFFPGAQARAAEFGYRLEDFWLKAQNMSPERMAAILRTRGIHGVLVGRLPVGQRELDFDFAPFSSVALGLTLESPRLHHVAEDHFFTARHAMMQCIERGYRRIGLVWATRNDYARVGDRWLGGFACQQHRLPERDRLPPFERDDDQAAFHRWLREHRPDALLSTNAAATARWLQSAGWRTPQDVGLVDLRWNDPASGITGIRYHAPRLGALAVDMLVGLLHRHESGVPVDPHEVLLKGEWVEGNTLPRRSG